MEQNEDETVQQNVENEDRENDQNEEKEENECQKEQKITNELFLIKEAKLKLKEIEEGLEKVDYSKNKIEEINEESKEYFELDEQLKDEKGTHEKKIKLIEEDITTLEQCFSISQQKYTNKTKDFKKQEYGILKNLKEIEEKINSSSSTLTRQTQQLRPSATLPPPFQPQLMLQAINATIQQQFQQGLQQLQQTSHQIPLNLQPTQHPTQQSLQNIQKLKATHLN
uniref:Uncharacterized protein n=1 Tax=Meloidogyne hapla TaxID=6305 RepID=A0A1I8BT43_MELHA